MAIECLSDNIKNMNNKRIHRFFSLFLLIVLPLFLFHGCKDFRDITLGEIQDFELNGFSGNVAKVSVYLPVKNPRGIGFRLTQMDLDMYYDGDFMGNVKNEKAVRIPRKSVDRYEIPLRVELPGMFGAIRAMKFFKDPEGEIKFTGTVKVKYFLMVGKTIQINETYDFQEGGHLSDSKSES